MAYRAIHTKIWKDAWFLELDADGKLLFIYLCTNELTNVLGLYELSPKVAAFETGLELERTKQLLAQFKADSKLDYENGWVWIRNLMRYNLPNPGSPKTQKYIRKVLSGIPNGRLKAAFVEYYTTCIPLLSHTDTEQHIHDHDITSSGHDHDMTSSSSGADAPENHDDDVGYANDDVEPEPTPEPTPERPDKALVDAAVLALLERNWNAGEKKAAEFACKWGPQYIVDMCDHAKRVGLEAGWIRESAGSFTPGQKWESARERRERAKNRGPTSLDIAESLERWM